MKTTEIIEACENRLIAAILKNDLEIIEELLHERLLFNTPTGQTITKAMDVENLRLGVMKVLEYSPSDQLINMIEEVAIVAVTIRLVAKVGDSDISGNFRFLRVWKLFDSSWKVIAISGFQI